tara:strand:- start:193 stop:375 length:183 start_codon:yes stop_codon:yes gene_type:complete
MTIDDLEQSNADLIALLRKINTTESSESLDEMVAALYINNIQKIKLLTIGHRSLCQCSKK